MAAGTQGPAQPGPTGPVEGVLFDLSGTLFHIESARAALGAALGPEFVDRVADMIRWGAINGSPTPEVVPPHLAQVWAGRDLSAADHRAAYAGMSRHAGLTEEQSERLYARGISPAAWTPFPETVPLLHRLHEAGVPVAVVSNIGWDPRPVLARHGVEQDLDVLVLSYERGVQKPDPEIFRMACHELGVPPGSAVMIGDNPEADGAATALGIHFVLVAADPQARSGREFAQAVGLEGDGSDAPGRR